MAIEKPHEMHTRRRGRNWGVMATLVALVVLLFAVTIVKLGPNAANPSKGASWGESLQKWFSE